MNIVDTKGVMSSKKGVAEVNNGLPEKGGMELSQIRWNFREREDILVSGRQGGGTGHDMLGESGGSVAPDENPCFILPAPSL